MPKATPRDTLPKKVTQAKKATLDQKTKRSTSTKQTPTVTTPPKGNTIVWPTLAALWVLLLYLALLMCQWTWSTARIKCTVEGPSKGYTLEGEIRDIFRVVETVIRDVPLDFEFVIFLTSTNTANLMWLTYNVFNNTSVCYPAIVACLLALIYACERGQLSCP